MDRCEPANQKRFPGEESHFLTLGATGQHWESRGLSPKGSAAPFKSEMRNGCLMGTGFLGGGMKMF